MPYSNKEKIKEYNHQYHLKNWGKRKQKHGISKKKRRENLILWFKLYKKQLACKFCKENHPACLDFHHINSIEKEGNISSMVGEGYSEKAILREIKNVLFYAEIAMQKHITLLRTEWTVV